MEALNKWFFGCVIVSRKLKTQEEEQQSDDRLVEEEISFPSEIMEDILSRLPVKSILRFKSVSKPWLSIISTPSFTKLQLTRATTALFITAVNVSTNEKYFLTASHDGGSFTHLMTVKPPRHAQVGTEDEHLNGLVSSISTFGYFHNKEALVVNPTTTKLFKVPDPASGTKHVQYFFGFDELRNEHKVLAILGVGSNATIQIMVFSMLNNSWRKIDATDDIVSPNRWSHIRSSVCVNSVIHLLNLSKSEILAFDLRTNKFSVVELPPNGLLPVVRYQMLDDNKFRYKLPYLIKVGESIGVVCHYRAVQTNKMRIWILQDYEKCMWVMETVAFPESWVALGYPFPMDSVNMDEIIFSFNKLSTNVISAPIYNMKSRCFRFVQFTLSHPFLCSETLQFSQIKCYVESIFLYGGGEQGNIITERGISVAN